MATKSKSRKKAKWGHRTRYLLGSDGISHYRQSDVRKLAKDYGLPKSVRQKDLKEWLEGAAQTYKNWKANWDDLPRRGEVKAAIDEIYGLSSKLKMRLHEMDSRTEMLFWKPEIEVHNDIFIVDKSETRFGHTIHRRKLSNRDTLIHYIDPPSIGEALTILENYSKEALLKLPEDAGGRRHSEALRMWTYNMAGAWQELFGKKFTLDYEKGKPRSEAAYFCIDAFKALDPKKSPSSIITAMKKVIGEKRKKLAGRNPPQKKT